MDSERCFDRADGEEQQERSRHGPHQRVHLTGAALEDADQDKGDEAGTQDNEDDGRTQDPATCQRYLGAEGVDRPEGHPDIQQSEQEATARQAQAVASYRAAVASLQTSQATPTSLARGFNEP